MTRYLLLPVAALALAGCETKVVTKVVTKEVRVPVYTECVDPDQRPTTVTPIKQRFTREQWDAMPTHQRDALLHSNGARRVVYENKAEVVITGCETPPEKPLEE